MNNIVKGVLLVDREPTWLTFCSDVLHANGYSAHVALSVADAFEILSHLSEQDIDLILIDASLFEESSPDFSPYDEHKNKFGRSIVIVFPTNLTPDRARSAFKLGATDCVNKPYDEIALLALVEQAFADYRLTLTIPLSVAQDTRKVLIVDDDADWARNLTRYLPPVDEATVCTSFQEATDQIDLFAYDIAVVDLRLVDADDSDFQGMRLIPLIRDRDKERGHFTQIIVVSAHGTPEHIRRSYATYGIYYYFDKRYFSKTKYHDAIEKALSGVPD